MFSTISAPKTIKAKHQNIANILAFALLPLSGFATDIYIPSLPNMAAEIGVSSIQVQLTLTLFLISYGVTQLFIGSVLDSYGRYNISLVCLVLFAVASLVIANTHSIYMIYLMRILHGITVGGVVVAKRAYFIDLFTGDKLKHYLSLFSIIWSTGPIVAPFIGGYLQIAYGWKSNFYFLALFAVVLAVLEVIFSGESLRVFSGFHIKKIAGIYAGMIKTTSFMLGLIMIGLAYSMVMIYNMTGPFIIEHTLKLSPVIAGYSSLVLGLAWLTGGVIGKSTLNRPFFQKTAINMAIQVVFVIGMSISLNYAANLYTLIFFAFIIQVGAGNTFNNFFTYCLSRFPKNAGIASGLTGGVNYVIVSILSYGIVFILPAKDAHHLSYSYLILIVLSVVTMIILKLKKEIATDQA